MSDINCHKLLRFPVVDSNPDMVGQYHSMLTAHSRNQPLFTLALTVCAPRMASEMWKPWEARSLFSTRLWWWCKAARQQCPVDIPQPIRFWLNRNPWEVSSETIMAEKSQLWEGDLAIYGDFRRSVLQVESWNGCHRFIGEWSNGLVEASMTRSDCKELWAICGLHTWPWLQRVAPRRVWGGIAWYTLTPIWISISSFAEKNQTFFICVALVGCYFEGWVLSLRKRQRMRWPFQKWWNFRQTPQFYTTMTGQIGEVADVAESSRTRVWFIDQGHSCCCTSLGVPWKESMDVNQPAFGNARQSKHIGHKDATTSYAKKMSSNFRTVFLLVVSIQQHAWPGLEVRFGTKLGQLGRCDHWQHTEGPIIFWMPDWLGMAGNILGTITCRKNWCVRLLWFCWCGSSQGSGRVWPETGWSVMPDLPQTVASLCSSYHGDGQCCCRLEFEATGIPNGGPAMGVFYCINNTDKNILVCYIYIYFLFTHTHTEI